MVFIPSSYDVVFTYSPISEITGHVFECFDYYLLMRNKCKAGILFMDGLNMEQLKLAFNSKYNVDFSEVEDDIIQLSHEQLQKERIYKFGSNTTVFLCDGNIKSLADKRIFLATNKLYGFMCGQYGFENVKTNNHITYLQDYRIYGQNKHFKSYDYVKKIPFQFYKEVHRKPQNVGMMYVTFACRKITPEVVKQYHEMSGCSNSILVVPYERPEYDSIDDVEQVVAPVQDFFQKFDTYIYTPVERHFDCSPRLVTECTFYKKQVLMNINYADIGLQTRMMDCKESFQALQLEDDDLVQQIVEQNMRGK